MAAWTSYECTQKKTIAAFRQVYGAFRTQRLSIRAKNGRVVRRIGLPKQGPSLVFQVSDAECSNLDLILVPGWSGYNKIIFVEIKLFC